MNPRKASAAVRAAVSADDCNCELATKTWLTAARAINRVKIADMTPSASTVPAPASLFIRAIAGVVRSTSEPTRSGARIDLEIERKTRNLHRRDERDAGKEADRLVLQLILPTEQGLDGVLRLTSS